MIVDIVHHSLPPGAIGAAVQGPWIRCKLDEIFRFRYHVFP